MSADPTRDPEELLVEYVRRALDARERGEEVDPAEVCRDHPELASEVAEVLGLGEGMAVLREVDAAEPGAGRVLAGRYRLDARLGRGAMGVVWSGTDLELDRVVAIKLFETLGKPGENDAERFRREAQALATLQHEHVVRIHDRGEADDGTLFLVMERLSGVPLSVLLERAESELPEGADFIAWLEDVMGGIDAVPPESTWLRSVVRWCADVASGLTAAHACAVYHRDVKPSNIVVRRDIDAVLLDFGIAARAGDPALTAGDSTLGTPWYMAPEQASGSERASPWIDVYGLSATLYHLATGHPPYEGDAMRVVQQLQHRDPRPPSRIRPDLPRDLCAILEKGMDRDLRRRYPTVAELESDLRAFLAHRPVAARPLTWFGRQVRRARRAPARTLAATATILAIVLAGIVVPLWSSHDARQREVGRAEIFATLPALLALEGQPAERLLQDLDERGASLAALDALLDFAPDDLPHRLWRAALLLDQGEHVRAADDLREIVARAGDSDHVRAVAQAYLDADPDQRGTEAVDLDDLPEPSTDFDRYVAGFHELRNRHRDGFAQRSHDHLAAIADRYPPARDLLVIALLARAELEKDPALFRQAADETIRQEGHLGRATARTLALRGAAFVGLGRFEEAVPLLEESDRLRPDRHGPIHNLGVALRRLGEYERAEQCFERAHALRPHFWNTTYMLALLHKDRGHFDRALDLAAAMPEDLPAAEAWRRSELRATILLRRAISTHGAAETAAASKADAEAAIAAFEEGRSLTDARSIRAKLAVRRQVAEFVARSDDLGATRSLVNLLRLTPDDPYEIANLATLLPDDGLDPTATAWLRSWLRRLAIALAKGDPAFRVGQKARLKAEEGR